MSQLDHWEVGADHEKDDSLEKTGVRWGCGFGIFILIGGALSFAAYLFLTPRPFAGPIQDPAREIPSERPLQDNATVRTDIAELRQREDGILTTAGPSDYHPGAQRIPIEQAIDQLARTGLPRHSFKPGSYQLAPSASEVH